MARQLELSFVVVVVDELHPLEVEIFFDPPDMPFRESLLAAGNLIHIHPAARIVTSVELVGNAFDIKDDNVGEQSMCIDA